MIFNHIHNNNESDNDVGEEEEEEKQDQKNLKNKAAGYVIKKYIYEKIRNSRNLHLIIIGFVFAIIKRRQFLLRMY